MNQNTLGHLYRTRKLIPAFSADETKMVRSQLLQWYHRNRRQLPWRGDKLDDYPMISPSPYGTWISEIMLQQTRVETVIDYWYRWMLRFPSIEVLAAATIEEVNALWSGLGYYRRAAQILACAKLVKEKFNGVLPANTEELLKLPGIGPYTAGAISSIAFGNATGVVDGNVIRVLSRMRAIDILVGPTMDKLCWKLMNPLVDPRQPGEFNQAIMELGATLCKPTSPRCEECPIDTVCHARQLSDIASSSHIDKNTGEKREVIDVLDVVDVEDLIPLPKAVTEFPKRAPKKTPKPHLFVVCVLCMNCSSSKDKKYLLVQRPPNGLLQNQWEFPSLLQSPEDLSNNYESMAHDDKTKFWFEQCQHYLRRTFGIQINTSNAADLPSPKVEIHTNDIHLHPEPIVHVFSHQKHTMHIVEVTFDPHFSINVNQPELQSDAIFEILCTLEDKPRDALWMTYEELTSKGITTGVQKIFNLTNTVRNNNEEKKAKQKSSRKTNVKKSPKKRKITEFFSKE